MNGAEALMRTAARAGFDVCFANPGTTEMHLVEALDAVPQIRPVLGLFEGVCTGAADGYARIAQRPAMVLLHLAPGLANGLANLHNARRAGTPMVIVVGDHASWHRPFDPPLAGEIEGLARAIDPAAWIRTSSSAKSVGRDLADATHASMAAPGRLAFLIVPADFQWENAEGEAAPLAAQAPAAPATAQIEAAARVLDGDRTALLLGGAALRGPALEAAGRVAAATTCRLLTGSFPGLTERGAGLPAIERLPYFPEAARQAVRDLRDVVVVASPEPVTFFGYPGIESRVLPESCERHFLTEPDQDCAAALDALAAALGAPARSEPATGTSAASPNRPHCPSGLIDPVAFGRTIASVQPEGAIVVDEALTTATGYWEIAATAPPYTHLCLTGGAIGMGLPAATGAALAAPERPVLCLQADGSGMYTLQALWTCAREQLDVTVVLCANRSYRILEIERDRAQMAAGPSSRTFTELDRPALDWCGLAEAQGVPAERVERSEDLAAALRRGLGEPGPHLIEASIATPQQR